MAEMAKKEVEKNCDAFEIYVDETKSIELDSRKDELNFAKEEIECGIGIRVIKDNKQGFAFTSNMEKIAESAMQAIENTKLTKADENYAFATLENVPSRRLHQLIFHHPSRRILRIGNCMQLQFLRLFEVSLTMLFQSLFLHLLLKPRWN